MREIIKKPKWDRYYYRSKERFRQKKIKDESEEVQIEKVKYTLNRLKELGIIDGTEYNKEDFLRFRQLVKDTLFIFWTAINPPVERLLYALSEIIKPKNILGLGVFTGNPVVWSFGPAIEGTYEYERMVAVEIDENNARIMNENFTAMTKENEDDKKYNDIVIETKAEDGFEVLKEYEDESIDLIYLDANGFDPTTGKNSKNINYTFAKEGYSKLKPGGYLMCHNVFQKSFKKHAKMYLDFIADDKLFDKSAIMAIDEMGVNISRKR